MGNLYDLRESQIQKLWPHFSTAHIAKALNLPESVVYNHLAGQSVADAMAQHKRAESSVKKYYQWRAKKRYGATALTAAISMAFALGKAGAQDNYPAGAKWTDEQRAQIYRYYQPVGEESNSTHWHDGDCCQQYRCFPARPGAVRWSPDGIAITHPDGDVLLYAEDSEIWKPKEYEGVRDPRYHICFEVVGGAWKVLCGYKGGIHG